MFLLFLIREQQTESGKMGQDELVLRVPPDAMSTSRSLKQRDAKTPEHVTTSKQRSHSRESSGASNVSVKFTVHSDGSASPKASVTTNPYQFEAKLKPCLRKRTNESDASERRERRRRKHLQPRGNDGGGGAKSDDLSHEESFCDDDDDESDDSLNVDDVGDRLSPELNENGSPRVR